MKVMLVEDEKAIRGLVTFNLQGRSIEIAEVESGEEALGLARRERDVDIALLDAMLPDMSGFETCARLRAVNPRMGIIMLSALGHEADIVRGLEAGADDYVQKPVRPGELLARIQSLYRRLNVPAPAIAPEAEPASTPAPAASPMPAPAADGLHRPQDGRAGGLVRGRFRLSVRQRKLWKGADAIELTPTEWAIVHHLMERAGDGVSRDAILDAVWGRHYFGDLKIVDVNIRRIRRKLEDDPSHPSVIETVWGFGYRWKEGTL